MDRCLMAIESDHDNLRTSEHDNRWSGLASTRSVSTGGLFSIRFGDVLVRRRLRLARIHQRPIQGTSRPSLRHRSVAA